MLTNICNYNSQLRTPNLLIVVKQKSFYFFYKAAALLSSRNTVCVKAQCEPAIAVKMQHPSHAVYACGVKQHEPHLGLAFYNGALVGQADWRLKKNTNVKLVILIKDNIHE